MGTCMSKKKRSSSSSSVSATNKSVSSSTPHLQPQAFVTVVKSQVEPEREASLKKENKQEAEEGQVKKEIFIIKHRKSYSDGGGNGFEKISKYAFSDGVASITMDNVAAEAKEVDEILLECGRLSRNPSGKALSSGERGRRRRKHSASKRSHDLDDCENDTTTNAIGNSGILCEDDDGLTGENQLQQHRHQRRRSPVASSERRRRTPSRERDQQQRSSSKERRLSRSPSKRPSEATTYNPPSNNINNNATTRPGKMLSVPPTVSSLALDKSNNGGGGIMRVSVRRNVGAASPRSLSPARANGKGTLFSENQQQPSLSRNSSRKADQSPYRRNPLSEIDVNSLAYSQSANNNSNRFQSRSKREIEPQANQKTKVDTNNIESRTSRMKTKEQQEVKEQSSMAENVNPRTACSVITPSGLENNLKPQTLTLTRSRSSRRSQDLDHLLNNGTVGVPSQSYTSLLLEDIQNFHQNNNNNDNPTSIPLPACIVKACSILEAVADLNSASTRSNFSVNHYAKRVPGSSMKEHPFVESEVNVSDDVMEPSLHKYVTVSRDGSLLGGGVFDVKDQGSSESNSFTVSGQRDVGLSSSLKPNSGDSTDFWNSSKRECVFQRIGSGRFGDIKDVHAIPIVVTAAGST